MPISSKYDAHFLYFYNARTHRLDSYPDWQQPEGYRAQARPWYQTLSGEGDDLVWFGPYPAFDSAGEVLTLIKRVKDDEGQLLGLLMVDMSFNALQRALHRAVGEDPVALYITERKGGKLVVGHNLSLLPPRSSGRRRRPAGRVLGRSPPATRSGGDGVGSQRLSPLPFSRNLQDTLLMVVLPALALLCIWLCSLWFLVRIFRQEQALVQGSLSGLIRDEARKEIQRRQRTWFVHGSLGR